MATLQPSTDAKLLADYRAEAFAWESLARDVWEQTPHGKLAYNLIRFFQALLKHTDHKVVTEAEKHIDAAGVCYNKVLRLIAVGGPEVVFRMAKNANVERDSRWQAWFQEYSLPDLVVCDTLLEAHTKMRALIADPKTEDELIPPEEKKLQEKRDRRRKARHIRHMKQALQRNEVQARKTELRKLSPTKGEHKESSSKGTSRKSIQKRRKNARHAKA